jgi:GNAT superfamily N-acetyltransferase
MTVETEIRVATSDDVSAICKFGRDVVRPHYEPIVGREHALAQVGQWWSESYLRQAVKAQLVIVADAAGEVVGVAQRGRSGADDVIYKLYVRPAERGHGLGPRLIAAIVEQLPANADRVWVEQLAANTRAAAFYQREGFIVERVEPSAGGDARTAQVWYSRAIKRR